MAGVWGCPPGITFTPFLVRKGAPRRVFEAMVERALQQPARVVCQSSVVVLPRVVGCTSQLPRQTLSQKIRFLIPEFGKPAALLRHPVATLGFPSVEAPSPDPFPNGEGEEVFRGAAPLYNSPETLHHLSLLRKQTMFIHCGADGPAPRVNQDAQYR